VESAGGEGSPARIILDYVFQISEGCMTSQQLHVGAKESIGVHNGVP